MNRGQIPVESLRDLYEEIQSRRVDLRENRQFAAFCRLEGHVGTSVMARLERIIREDNATLVGLTQGYRAWNAAVSRGSEYASVLAEEQARIQRELK